MPELIVNVEKGFAGLNVNQCAAAQGVDFFGTLGTISNLHETPWLGLFPHRVCQYN